MSGGRSFRRGGANPGALEEARHGWLVELACRKIRQNGRANGLCGETGDIAEAALRYLQGDSAIEIMAVQFENEVIVPVGSVTLDGELQIPQNAHGLVLFAHGSGSSRLSPRNQFVARVLREAGLGTLLFDLLTREEEVIDSFTRHLRFDIPLLAERLVGALRWVGSVDAARGLRIGYFGASTGGGAALVAAAQTGDAVGAIVSRGGRPDLASAWLPKVKCPTLLLVGELDPVVIELNRTALDRMTCLRELRLVPNATHLFEEPGTLDYVAREAAGWFSQYLKPEVEGS